MFKSLNEIIEYYQEKYRETQKEWYRVMIPGSSPQEIEALEHEFDVRIHPTLKNVLQSVDWDHSLSFNNLLIYGVHRLRSIHGPKLYGIPYPTVKESGYWEVGGSDGYSVYMQVDTGVIYTTEAGTREYKKAADNIEDFICVTASLVEHEWPDPDEDQVAALATVDAFLHKHNIVHGQKFWRSIAMDWA